MDDRLAKELRAAIDEHADSPELRELWLRVLGLQLLAEDLSRQPGVESATAGVQIETAPTEDPTACQQMSAGEPIQPTAPQWTEPRKQD